MPTGTQRWRAMLVGRSAPACGTEGVEVVDRPWQVRLATEDPLMARLGT